MPFQHNYPHLGDTIRVRVPHAIFPHVSHMLSQFDRIASVSGIERVSHIADKIIEGLEAVDDN